MENVVKRERSSSEPYLRRAKACRSWTCERNEIGERVFAYSNGNRSYCSILNDRKAIIQKLLKHHGGVAQLGEHLPCKQGVKGSNPFISTIECGKIREERDNRWRSEGKG